MNANYRKLIMSLAITTLFAGSIIGCDRQKETGTTTTTNPSTPLPATDMAQAPSPTVGTQLDDSVVTARVKSALLGDSNIKSFDIGVETRKGEVQLSGFVDNQSQIDRAVEITRGIEGAKSVTNKMSVKK